MDRLPTASTITQFPGVVRCFYCWQRLFSAPRRGFFAGSPSKIVSTPYIYVRDELHYIFFLIFRLSTFDSSCFVGC